MTRRRLDGNTTDTGRKIRNIEPRVGPKANVGLARSQIVNSALVRNSTPIQHHDSIGCLLHVVETMRGHKHRSTIGCPLTNEIEHPGPTFSVERRCRLIEEEHVGSPTESERKREPLLLSTGKSPPAARYVIGQSARVQYRRLIDRRPMKRGKELKRLTNREPHRETTGLWHDSPSIGEITPIDNRVEPDNADRACCWPSISLNGFDRGRLAGPIWSEQAHHFAGSHREADIVDNGGSAELHRQLIHLDRGHTEERTGLCRGPTGRAK